MFVVTPLISLPLNIGNILIITHLTADLNTPLRFGIIVLIILETYKNVMFCGLWEILI